MKQASNKIITVPNILSLIRLFLVIPMIFALINQENILAVLIGFLATIIDGMDGYIARRFNQISEFGKMIDPFADKLFVGATIIILLVQARLPLWFALTIWIRDLLLLIGGLLVARKLKFVLPSQRFGKIAAFVVALTLLFAILGIETIAQYLYIFAAFMLISSFIYYTVRMIIIVKKEKNKREKVRNNN